MMMSGAEREWRDTPVAEDIKRTCARVDVLILTDPNPGLLPNRLDLHCVSKYMIQIVSFAHYALPCSLARSRTLSSRFAGVVSFAHARSYWFGGLTATFKAEAARNTKLGSLMSSRASETTSAWPVLRISSACAGSVISPTAPMARSGCAFLIASAYGTCNGRALVCHRRG
jgi:hypothetical protein